MISITSGKKNGKYICQLFICSTSSKVEKDVWAKSLAKQLNWKGRTMHKGLTPDQNVLLNPTQELLLQQNMPFSNTINIPSKVGYLYEYAPPFRFRLIRKGRLCTVDLSFWSLSSLFVRSMNESACLAKTRLTFIRPHKRNSNKKRRYVTLKSKTIASKVRSYYKLASFPGNDQSISFLSFEFFRSYTCN